MPKPLLHLFVALTLCLTSLPALAKDSDSRRPMNAEEFEAYVEGRTLTFAFQGQAYGIEEYLPGRRVRWAFVGDSCTEGVWYQSEDMICFDYVDNPESQCWHFYDTPRGLRGVFVGDSATELYEVRDMNQSLICPGPDVGV